MVHAGCVFVVGIHPSRTWMSGSFESKQWNACVQTRPRFILSPETSFGGMESEPMLTLREKSALSENSLQRRIEPTTLHHEDNKPNTWPMSNSGPKRSEWYSFEMLRQWEWSIRTSVVCQFWSTKSKLAQIYFGMSASQYWQQSILTLLSELTHHKLTH